MSSIRSKQIADIVRKQVADMLLNDVQDPRLSAVRLTDVRVSPDLAQAKLYFTLFNSETSNEVTLVLKKAAGFLRSELARRTAMRRVPKLHFEYDQLLDNGMDILNLIHQAVNEDNAAHG